MNNWNCLNCWTVDSSDIDVANALVQLKRSAFCRRPLHCVNGWEDRSRSPSPSEYVEAEKRTLRRKLRYGGQRNTGRRYGDLTLLKCLRASSSSSSWGQVQTPLIPFLCSSLSIASSLIFDILRGWFRSYLVLAMLWLHLTSFDLVFAMHVIGLAVFITGNPFVSSASVLIFPALPPSRLCAAWLYACVLLASSWLSCSLYEILFEAFYPLWMVKIDLHPVDVTTCRDL